MCLSLHDFYTLVEHKVRIFTFSYNCNSVVNSASFNGDFMKDSINVSILELNLAVVASLPVTM